MEFALLGGERTDAFTKERFNVASFVVTLITAGALVAVSTLRLGAPAWAAGTYSAVAALVQFATNESIVRNGGSILPLREFQVLKGHSGRVWHVAWDPIGSTLATCGSDRTVRIWRRNSSAADGAWVGVSILEMSHSRTIRSCEWSSCGRYLATTSFDATISIWKRTGEEFENIATLMGHDNEVKSVSWNSNKTLIATCSRDKTVWLWSADPEEEFECISVMNHEQDVKFVSWHPILPLLFSASYDHTVRVWAEGRDEEDWPCVDILCGHNSTVWGVAHSADGKSVVTCSGDRSLIVWRRSGAGEEGMRALPYDKWRKVCQVSNFHSRTILSVDWSHVTDTIVSGGVDASIKLFRENSDNRSRAASFELLASIEHAHDGDVTCVRWHPHDGTLLASTGDDDVVRLWRYDYPNPSTVRN